MIYQMHGIIFAYRSYSELRELVGPRTAASVPFGARYRLIDFMISNMANAGIGDIGVIVQKSYQSLLDHIGSGKDWDLSRRVGGLRLLPPFSYSSGGDLLGAHGFMEALSGVRSYLKKIRQPYVVLAVGDLAATIPLDEVLSQHLASGADITVVCAQKPATEPNYSTYLVPDEQGFAKEVICEPAEAPEQGLQSLEVYVMSTKHLLELVDSCAAKKLWHLSSDVLPGFAGGQRINIYVHKGYASCIRSLADYYRSSMELIDPEISPTLFLNGGPIRTKERTDAATYYSSEAVCKNSLIAAGCYIEGLVENSILFRGVHVEKGAEVRNCIIMQDGAIREKANLSHVITDKDVNITSYVTLTGHDRYPILIAKGKTI